VALLVGQIGPSVVAAVVFELAGGVETTGLVLTHIGGCAGEEDALDDDLCAMGEEGRPYCVEKLVGLVRFETALSDEKVWWKFGGCKCALHFC